MFAILQSRSLLFFTSVSIGLVFGSWGYGQDGLTVRRWKVQEKEREALVWLPSSIRKKGIADDATSAGPTGEKSEKKDAHYPIVFAFHGHGGSMKNAARTFEYHTLWPEAIVIYPQGIPTPGRITDPEGKRTGWQHGPGDQKDRDLLFFDHMLASMKEEYPVDESRIYATGHSNGGAFTYLLWATRGNQLAAIAPSAAVPLVQLRDKLKPIAVMHVAGEEDPLVSFERQLAGMNFLRKINDSSEEGKAWAENCTIYEGGSAKPVVTMITPGTHKFPEKAPPLIVRFFQENSK